MKLIICEKHTQAEDYVEIFEQYTNTKFSKETGFYTNGEYYISNAIGHLVQLAPAEMYNPDYKLWKVEHLPIIPNPFKLVINEEKKFQFKILKKLISEAKIIYNGTDAEREGELIFRYILNYTNLDLKNKVIKRIWANDSQYKTIIEAFENAKDQSDYNNLYLAAKARSESDWLIGINSTRMLTAASNTNTTLSLGRVQTAVLRLIVDRYNKNKNFIVENLYTPYVFINELSLELVYNQNFKNKEEAQQIINKTKEKSKIINQIKEIEIKQPLLFSLVDLQIHCNLKYNYSASQTLEFAQSLYEKRLISYPRTNSNYLTEALKKDTIESLIFFQENFFNTFSDENYTDHFLSQNEQYSHFIFNDKETSDHYAIIPLTHQNKTLEKINENELNVFNEIIKRFLQCFMKKAIKIDTFYKILVNDNDSEFYQNKISEFKYKGFLFLENRDKEITDDLKIVISDNKEYPLSKKEIKLSKTKPVDLFTEATLLKAMKNPLYYENIEENRDAIKSLGTQSTYDKFLPILIKRSYVIFQKKYVVPTELGLELISKLINTKIASIALTAQIEFEIENIRYNKLSYDKFMVAMHEYTKKLTNEIQSVAENINVNLIEENKKEKILCPYCKIGFLYMAPSKKNLYCSQYKAETPCNFILYTNISGAKLTTTDIVNLATKGITGIKTFTSSKTNEKFQAKIKFDTEFKTIFQFDKKEPGQNGKGSKKTKPKPKSKNSSSSKSN